MEQRNRRSFWIGLMTFAFVVWVAAIVFAIVWTNVPSSKSSFRRGNGFEAPRALAPSDIGGPLTARVNPPSVQAGATGSNFHAWLSAVRPSGQQGGAFSASAATAEKLDDSQYSLPDVNIHGKDVRSLMEAIVDRPDTGRNRIAAFERSRDVLRGNPGPDTRMLDFFVKGPYAKYMRGFDQLPVAGFDYDDGKADIVFGTAPNEASMG